MAKGKYKDIAIIGMDVTFGSANNPDDYWKIIEEGIDCVTDCPEGRKLDIERYLRYINVNKNDIHYKKAAYIKEIDKFDYEFFKISPREAMLMDPHHRLFLETAYHALEDAGYAGTKLEGSKTGIYVGFPTEYTCKVYQNIISETCPELAGDSFSGNLPAMLPARLSYYLNLKGPSLLIDTSCSSSLVAIHFACRGIISEECDLAIAGGIHLFVVPLINEILEGIGIVSPDGRARTFDDSCGGVGQGEGTGAILLKPLQKAIEDGDNIYAVIKGSAINQDGKSIGITAPNAVAQGEVLVSAWNSAGINPDSISYIEAHGTATKLGDPIEISGINKAFRNYTDRKQFCAVGSVKANIGHTVGAAGIASVVKVVQALKNKQIPPSIHFNRPNRKIKFEDSPVYVNDRLKKWDKQWPRRCGVSGFGISGTNCHIVLEEPPEYVKSPDVDEIHMLALSAQSIQALKDLLNKYWKFLKSKKCSKISDVCYTTNTGRRHMNFRLVMQAHDKRDLIQKIEFLKETDLSCFVPDGTFNKEIWLSTTVTNFAKCIENDEHDDENILNKIADAKLEEFIVSQSKDKILAGEICELYAKGASIKWDKIYRGAKCRLVSLPTYPFKRTRCWVDVPDIPVVRKSSLSGADFYRTVWLPKPFESKHCDFNNENILVFNDGSMIGDTIIHSLQQGGANIVEVNIGAEYRQISNRYIIQNNDADYQKLVRSIKALNISKVIHLLSLFNTDEPKTIEELQRSFKNGVYSMFNLVKSFSDNDINGNIDVVIISNHAYEISNEDLLIKPHNTALFGFAKAVKWEYPNLKCRCIDVGKGTTINNIVEEIQNDNNDYLVAYRDGQRLVEIVEEIELKDFEKRDQKIKEDGAYVLIGGVGRIGLKIGKLLADKNKVNLVLVNRSNLPERNTWDMILKENKQKMLCKKITEIMEIENIGSTVSLYDCDITNYAETSKLFDELRIKFGKINGIIQCAVSDGGKRIREMTEENLRESMIAKTEGTWILDNVTREDRLDFFIAFSTVMTLVSGSANGTYTASNSYLDSFSAYRNKRNKGTLTINWPEWKSIGLNERKATNEEKSIFKKMSLESGLEVFSNLMDKNVDRVIVGELNYESPVYGLLNYLPFKLSDNIKQEINKRNSLNRVVEKAVAEQGKAKNQTVDIKLLGRRNNSYSELEKRLGSAWAKIFGYKEINITDNFFEIGGDSIFALKLGIELENSKIQLEAADILKYQTIEKIADFMNQRSKKEA